MNPSPAPQEDVFRRVLKISRVNGPCVAIVAGVCALAALALDDFAGAVAGLLVSAGGMLEWRGHRRLVGRDPSGMRLLARSQLWVLGVICVYAITRLASFDAGYVRDVAIPSVREKMAAVGIDMDATFRKAGLRDDLVPLVRAVHFSIYGGVIFITCLYQGGLSVYYRRRSGAVARAMQTSTPTAMGSRFF